MAYTDSDLTKFENAISDHITGKRIVTITTADRSITYSNPSLADLLKARDIIKNELAVTAEGHRRSRVFRASYSKGL